ncbi:MAG: uracil-DNA glycosylase [bacterium]|nr:uracil-DNA glycosylase [bacterium]
MPVNRESLKQLERALHFEGVSFLPECTFVGSDLSQFVIGGARATSDVEAEIAPVSSPENALTSRTNRAACQLELLYQEALVCHNCRLSASRQNVVFGSGNSESPLICFVGEGPGPDEDVQGQPFVGPAGILLTQAIEKGLCLQREDLYLCNVVKCCPPDKQTPHADEVASCSHFIEAQLEIIRPKVIVTLGKVALEALCPDLFAGKSSKKPGIGLLRGQWRDWRGIPLMPTFHPAYLLRTPEKKREFWEDLKSVMAALEIGPRT